jgi:enoyl-CoA hydratase/carnithine racemase
MIEITEHGPVREIRLARPPVNALNLELVRRLDAAIADAARDAVGAIVLTGRPGVFSAGLDVSAIATLDAVGLGELVSSFFALQRRLAASPVPVVCAITGHCPAGGTVIALYCDRRIMAAGAFGIGLNEVQVGLFPGLRIFRVYARLIGEARAADLLGRGAMVAPDEARTIGLVDEVLPAAQVLPRALAFAAELAALPPLAYRRTRALVRQPLVDLLDLPEPIDLQTWITAETRACMARVLKPAASGG